MILAAPGASAFDRNQAAARVYQNLSGWVGGFLRNKGFHLGEDDREDILQHVLLRASTGTARFRGMSEGEAHGWCRRVVYNKAVDLVTITNREKSTDHGDVGANLEAQKPAGASASEVQRASEEIQALIVKLEETIIRTSRKADAPGILQLFRVHVDARLGATLEQQIERWAFTGDNAGNDGTEVAWVRARNRIYQWRKRGREAAYRAIKALAAAGLEDDSVSLITRFLGCKEGDDIRPGKEGKEAAS
jgi:hypothetical protein